MNNVEPRIYVACLAAYNNGYLHGAWINADQDSDLLNGEVKKILSKSPVPRAEEFAVHDFEGFGDVHINEYTGLETISELANFIVENGELAGAVLSHTNGDIDEARKLLEDCYHGEYASEEDFAYYWTHEVDCREIPEYLPHYIDYKAMAHDFFISDFFSIEIDHKVHVFSNC
jgi:antirestriction protein